MANPAEYARLAEDAFNRRDVAALAALWDPQFHYVGPGEETRGRDAAIARERALFTAFPDIRADLSRHWSANEHLTIDGAMRGTHDGPLRLGELVVPPTGRPIEVRFAAIFRFAAGLVAFERVYFDRLDLLQQLGLAPAGEGR